MMMIMAEKAVIIVGYMAAVEKEGRHDASWVFMEPPHIYVTLYFNTRRHTLLPSATVMQLFRPPGEVGYT